MLRDGKVYVPKDEKLRAEVIWLYHNMPVSQTSFGPISMNTRSFSTI